MAYSANLIPTMTSNTAPSGVASASSEYTAVGRFAYLAMDHTGGLNSAWQAAVNPPGWLQYQFPEAHIVTQYTLEDTGYAEGVPSTFTLKGSNNGSTWTTLDTQTGLTWSGGEKKTFPVNNSTAYSYYRLDITATYPSPAMPLLSEWEMMETVVEYTANIVPTMTSYTTPNGTAADDGNAGSPTYEGWHAFDHVFGTSYWYHLATSGYVQYQFIAPHVITRYTVTSRAVPNDLRTPKAWTFKSSNDGSAWDTLDTQTNISWDTVGTLTKTFDIANSTAYAYYRLAVSESNDANYFCVGELEMMETAGPSTEMGNLGVQCDVIGDIETHGVEDINLRHYGTISGPNNPAYDVSKDVYQHNHVVDRHGITAVMLPARTTAQYTTVSLADKAAETGIITMAKGYHLLHVNTDVAARVRLYVSATQRTADASRAVGTDPIGNHGCILDVVTTSGMLDLDLSPLVDGDSDSSAIPYAVQNLSGGAHTITVTLTYKPTEE